MNAPLTRKSYLVELPLDQRERLLVLLHAVEASTGPEVVTLLDAIEATLCPRVTCFAGRPSCDCCGREAGALEAIAMDTDVHTFELPTWKHSAEGALQCPDCQRRWGSR